MSSFSSRLALQMLSHFLRVFKRARAYKSIMSRRRFKDLRSEAMAIKIVTLLLALLVFGVVVEDALAQYYWPYYYYSWPAYGGMCENELRRSEKIICCSRLGYWYGKREADFSAPQQLNSADGASSYEN